MSIFSRLKEFFCGKSGKGSCTTNSMTATPQQKKEHTTSRGQHSITTPPRPKHKRYNAGSAKSLSGSIYVLAVFAGDKYWDRTVKEKRLNELYKAAGWISREAARYGKNVSFKYGTYGLDKTIKMAVAPGYGSGKEDSRVAHKALAAVGYKNIGQFYEWFKKNEKCDNCVIVVFAQGRGRSYAVAYSPEYHIDFFTESCVVYECYENGTPHGAFGIAHEVLHCFGAEDLYETFRKPKIVEQEAKKRYSNDIMHRFDYDINNLKIDEFTAWCVGLTDTWKDEFEIFLQNK